MVSNLIKSFMVLVLLVAGGLSPGFTQSTPIASQGYYCTLTGTGFCPASPVRINSLNQGIDTQNVYIVPVGTPGTITVLIQGSVIGDFTDAVTCGTSSTTTPNLLSCSGIYSAVRIRVSVFTGFTSVNLTYVGTSSVAKKGTGAVSSVTGSGTVSCSPTTGAVVCTGSGSGSPGGSHGDVQLNNGSGGFGAAHINDGVTIPGYLALTEPMSMGSGNPITETETTGSTGVTQYLLCSIDSSGNVVTSAANATGVYGVCQSTQTSGQSVQVAKDPSDTLAISGAAITINDLVGTGATPGRVYDLGVVNSNGVPNNIQVLGRSTSSASGAGQQINLAWYGPGHYGTLVVPAGVNSGVCSTNACAGMPASPQNIDCHAACSPTVAQLSNALVSNMSVAGTGQANSAVAITGPAAANGMNFLLILGAAEGGSATWTYTSNTANVYLDGSASAVTNIIFGNSAPIGTSVSCFSFPITGPAAALKCTTLAGTVTTS